MLLTILSVHIFVGDVVFWCCVGFLVCFFCRVCFFFFGVVLVFFVFFFFFSSRRRHTRWTGDWSSDVYSSDLLRHPRPSPPGPRGRRRDPRRRERALRIQLLGPLRVREHVRVLVRAAARVIRRTPR